MFIKEEGNPSGPLLMFLHGGGVSGWMWDKQVAYFQDYHLLIPDLPGHGQSVGLRFSIKDSATQLIEKLKETDRKVTVVGFSLGAQILIEMLHQAPNLIDNAMINSALVRPMPLLRRFIGPTIRSTAFLLKKESFAKLQAKELYIDSNTFPAYFRETKNMRSDQLIEVLTENMAFKIPENYSKANTNILVTVGQKEKAVMKKSFRDLITSHPNSKGIIFPNIGHGIPLADSDLFNKTLDAWLNHQPFPAAAIHLERG